MELCMNVIELVYVFLEEYAGKSISQSIGWVAGSSPFWPNRFANRLYKYIFQNLLRNRLAERQELSKTAEIDLEIDLATQGLIRTDKIDLEIDLVMQKLSRTDQIDLAIDWLSKSPYFELDNRLLNWFINALVSYVLLDGLRTSFWFHF